MRSAKKARLRFQELCPPLTVTLESCGFKINSNIVGDFFMTAPSVVNWDEGSDFIRFVRERTAQKSGRYGGKDDPLEALSEVYRGISKKFTEGQNLDESRVRLLAFVINRRVI